MWHTSARLHALAVREFAMHKQVGVQNRWLSPICPINNGLTIAGTVGGTFDAFTGGPIVNAWNGYADTMLGENPGYECFDSSTW